jgi:hypothetical protein
MIQKIAIYIMYSFRNKKIFSKKILKAKYERKYIEFLTLFPSWHGSCSI